MTKLRSLRLYIQYRLLPLLFLDFFGLNLAFVLVVMMLKYLLGEDFGAVQVIKTYVSLWIPFSIGTLLVQGLFGSYRSSVRNLDLSDWLRLVSGLFVSFLGYYLIRTYTLDLFVPRYFVLLHAVFALLLIGLFRTLFQSLRSWLPKLNAGPYLLSKRTLIVGAGQAGQSVAAILLNDPEKRGNPVAYVDDDPAKKGKKFNGLPVLGDRHAIPKIARDYGVERIILAIPFPKEEDSRDILRLCAETPCEVMKANFGDRLDLQRSYREQRRLLTEAPAPATGEQQKKPGLSLGELDRLLLEAEQGEVSLSASSREAFERAWQEKSLPLELNVISTEERLQRPLPNSNSLALRRRLRGKCLLVAGCGDLGGEIARLLLGYEPAHLILVDPSARALFTLSELLSPLCKRIGLPEDTLSFLVCDTADTEALTSNLGTLKPDYLFWAAGEPALPGGEKSTALYKERLLAGLTGLYHLAKQVSASGVLQLCAAPGLEKKASREAVHRLLEEEGGRLSQSLGVPSVRLRLGPVLNEQGTQLLPLRYLLHKNPAKSEAFQEAVARLRSCGPWSHTLNEAATHSLDAVLLFPASGLYLLRWGEPISSDDLFRAWHRESKNGSEADLPQPLHPAEPAPLPEEKMTPTALDGLFRLEEGGSPRA